MHYIVISQPCAQLHGPHVFLQVFFGPPGLQKWFWWSAHHAILFFCTFDQVNFVTFPDIRWYMMICDDTWYMSMTSTIIYLPKRKHQAPTSSNKQWLQQPTRLSLSLLISSKAENKSSNSQVLSLLSRSSRFLPAKGAAELLMKDNFLTGSCETLNSVFRFLSV
jgi:hypothetical protein